MTFRKNCSYCFLRRKGRIFSEKLTLRDLSRVSYGNQKAGVVLWWRFAFPNSRLNRGSLKPEKKRADAGSRKPSCNRINQFARFSKKNPNFFCKIVATRFRSETFPDTEKKFPPIFFENSSDLKRKKCRFNFFDEEVGSRNFLWHLENSKWRNPFYQL